MATASEVSSSAVPVRWALTQPISAGVTPALAQASHDGQGSCLADVGETRWSMDVPWRWLFAQNFRVAIFKRFKRDDRRALPATSRRASSTVGEMLQGIETGKNHFTKRVTAARDHGGRKCVSYGMADEKEAVMSCRNLLGLTLAGGVGLRAGGGGGGGGAVGGRGGGAVVLAAGGAAAAGWLYPAAAVAVAVAFTDGRWIRREPAIL